MVKFKSFTRLLVIMGTLIVIGSATSIVDNKEPVCIEIERKDEPPISLDNFIDVKGGNFSLGSDETNIESFGDEKPKVITKVEDFRLLKTEVTYGMWYLVYPEERKINMKVPEKCDECPVSDISWSQISTFVNAVNSLSDTIIYRLPTEVEWEYAAKGGVLAAGKKYSGSDIINDVSWYLRNTSRIQPVMKKKPNELGLYDMSGNVAEWCGSNYWSYIGGIKTMNLGSRSDKYVLRGGGCGSDSTFCRVTCRVADYPKNHHFDYGFRLVAFKRNIRK